MSKSFRILLLAIGLFLFVWAIHSVGLEPLWLQIGTIGWRIMIVLAVYAVIFGLDTWGWHFAFPQKLTQSFRWRNLFGCRMAGEAINYVTPFAALGGEPIKAQLLNEHHRISWSDGLASLIIAKTSFVIGLVVLILSGLGLALWHSTLANPFKLLTLGLTLLLISLIGLFWILQQRGLVRWIWRAIRALIPNLLLQKTSPHAGTKLNRKLTLFYRRDRNRFLLSVFFHFLGWTLGIVEVYLILKFLGIEVSWRQAWILESLWQLVKALSFFIPAALGDRLFLKLLPKRAAVNLGLRDIRNRDKNYFSSNARKLI